MKVPATKRLRLWRELHVHQQVTAAYESTKPDPASPATEARAHTKQIRPDRGAIPPRWTYKQQPQRPSTTAKTSGSKPPAPRPRDPRTGPNPGRAGTINPRARRLGICRLRRRPACYRLHSYATARRRAFAPGRHRGNCGPGRHRSRQRRQAPKPSALADRTNIRGAGTVGGSADGAPRWASSGSTRAGSPP